jgi:hypothetical protein
VPTVLRNGPYRFFFYAGDESEPPHVHVERDENEAKYWLDPVRLARSYGFSAKELNSIEKIVIANQPLLQERWNEFFNG